MNIAASAEFAASIKPGDLIRLRSQFPAEPSYHVVAVDGTTVEYRGAYMGRTYTAAVTELSKHTPAEDA